MREGPQGVLAQLSLFLGDLVGTDQVGEDTRFGDFPLNPEAITRLIVAFEKAYELKLDLDALDVNGDTTLRSLDRKIAKMARRAKLKLDVRDLMMETVNASLNRTLSEMQLGDTNIFVLFGYPRSDIGKGNLIARLATIPTSTTGIIKFDGVLNTNWNRRSGSERDDFAIYKNFHKTIRLERANQILGGEVLASFISEFGESNDHLQFTPHVAKYFATVIYKNWIQIDRPANLFIEIGGTFTDPEVVSYVIPGLRVLKRYHDRIDLALLTELEHDGKMMKTKIAQSGLIDGIRQGVSFNLLFARMPSGQKTDTLSINYFENHLERKLKETFIPGEVELRVIALPHFESTELDGYLEYVRSRRDEIFLTR